MQRRGRPAIELPADWEPLPAEGAALEYRRRVEKRGWLVVVTMLWCVCTVAAVAHRLATPWSGVSSLDLWLLFLVGLAVWLVGLAVWAFSGREVWRFEPGCIEIRRSLWGIRRAVRIRSGVLEIDRSIGGGGAVSCFRLWVFDGHRSWFITDDRGVDALRPCALELSEYTRFPLRTRP